MSESKRSIWLSFAGLCGVVTPLVMISLLLLIISYSPRFSWSDNALSDLGVHEAAVFFNSSLMIGGFFTLIFALGLAHVLSRSRIGIIGVVFLFLAATSLFAIGLFPETAGRIHLYVSVSFFTFDILSMIVIGFALTRESSGRIVGIFSLVASLFAIAVWVVFSSFPYKGVAIPEMLSWLATSAWSMMMGARLFIHTSKS